MLVRVASYPRGPRVWIAGQRCHHGAVGCALAVALLARGHRRAAAAAAILALHDRHDWREWFAREGWPNVTNVTDSLLDSELSTL